MSLLLAIISIQILQSSRTVESGERDARERLEAREVVLDHE